MVVNVLNVSSDIVGIEEALAADRALVKENCVKKIIGLNIAINLPRNFFLPYDSSCASSFLAC